MSVARVQARGQVTVPQEIREACDIKPGSDLFFDLTGPETFECRVLPPRKSILEVVAQYTVPGVAPDARQLDEEMAEDIAREFEQERAQLAPEQAE